MTSNAIDCVSPNDGRLLGRVPVTTSADLAQTLERLQDRVVPWELRASVLRALAQSIRAAKQTLANGIIDELGKTREEADGEVDYACTFLDAAANWVDGAQRESAPAGMTGVWSVPIGLACLVTAYNDPLAGITRKIAPAIAAGCPVIVKPSPLGAQCALQLAALLPREAVAHIQFAFLDDSRDVARLLAARGVAIVSMTGSTAAGRAIAAAAALRPIPAVLELGGNCPLVVFPDADLPRAARDLLDRKVRAAGQACSSVNRVLVHADVFAQFTEEVSRLLPGYVCGRSDRAGVTYGPLRTQSAVARLDALEARCVAEGAALLARAPLQDQIGGAFCRPLSIVVTHEPSILDSEETFGPLLLLKPFRDDAELATELARNRQNLAAYLYGAHAREFLATRPALRFGSIGFGTTRIQGADVPTGGFGDAGYGREGGAWGIEAFRTTINLRSA